MGFSQPNRRGRRATSHADAVGATPASARPFWCTSQIALRVSRVQVSSRFATSVLNLDCWKGSGSRVIYLGGLRLRLHWTRNRGDHDTERVLFVDDEPSVLDGIRRTLRKQVDIQTAAGGADGLRIMQEAGPFALVVSDMRMPGMSGPQFLAKVREQAPETVRMILSGQADFQATIAAVNEGHIYRFLSKPCPGDQLFAAITDGLNQYRLITAEKVLLEQTLSGSVKMLIEILGLVSPGRIEPRLPTAALRNRPV